MNPPKYVRELDDLPGFVVKVVVNEDGDLEVFAFRKSPLGDQYYVPLGFSMGSNYLKLEKKEGK